MTKRELLLDKIKEHNGIITTKEALELGVHKDILKELTLKHEIVKIANGLYGLPNEEIDEYFYEYNIKSFTRFFHRYKEKKKIYILDGNDSLIIIEFNEEKKWKYR